MPTEQYKHIQTYLEKLQTLFIIVKDCMTLLKD